MLRVDWSLLSVQKGYGVWLDRCMSVFCRQLCGSSVAVDSITVNATRINMSHYGQSVRKKEKIQDKNGRL
jgi:hypothetical protein